MADISNDNSFADILGQIVSELRDSVSNQATVSDTISANLSGMEQRIIHIDQILSNMSQSQAMDRAMRSNGGVFNEEYQRRQ